MYITGPGGGEAAEGEANTRIVAIVVVVVGAGGVDLLGLSEMGGSPALASGVWPLDLVVGTDCQPRTVFLRQMQPADGLCGPGQVT